jgi:hypothetical protein
MTVFLETYIRETVIEPTHLIPENGSNITTETSVVTRATCQKMALFIVKL